MAERTTKVDGLNVRYLEEGAGQPVIMLHGASLGSSSDSFQCCSKLLADGGVRAIAVDRPGYGDSDGPLLASPAAHRKFVLGFMDALGLSSAILVGHSQQGGVAAQLTLDNTDRVPRSVILGGGGALPPPPGGAGEPDGERLTQEPTKEWTRHQLEENLYHHELITDEAIDLRHRMSIGKPFKNYAERPAPGGGGGGGAPAGEPLWKRVGASPERFLLLFGRQDKPHTAACSEQMMQAYPKVPFFLLDGCSHLVHWDHTDVFVRETLAFVKAGAVAV